MQKSYESGAAPTSAPSHAKPLRGCQGNRPGTPGRCARSDSASPSLAPPGRQYLRQEPDALAPLVRLRGGGCEPLRTLLRPVVLAVSGGLSSRGLPFRWCGWLHAVQIALERIDMCGPEPSERRQPRLHLLKWFGFQAVETALCLHRGLYES